MQNDSHCSDGAEQDRHCSIGAERDGHCSDGAERDGHCSDGAEQDGRCSDGAEQDAPEAVVPSVAPSSNESSDEEIADGKQQKFVSLLF